MRIKQYRKRPTSVLAIQWLGTNFEAVMELVERPEGTEEGSWEKLKQVVQKNGFFISNRFGKQQVNPGDYLVKDGAEIIVYTRDDFEQSMELTCELPRGGYVRIKSWEDMRAQYGLGDPKNMGGNPWICVPNGFTVEMEAQLPLNRIISVTPKSVLQTKDFQWVPDRLPYVICPEMVAEYIGEKVKS